MTGKKLDFGFIYDDILKENETENEISVNDAIQSSLVNTGKRGEDDHDSIIVQHEFSEEPLIAVLITDSAGTCFHKTLQVRGTKDYIIQSQAGTDNYSADKTVDLKDYFAEKKINSCTIMLSSCEDTDEGIQLVSVKKGGILPVYPGNLKIYWSEEKEVFYLVNELGLESYLPGVVSSEMPERFGLEALKAQAVCARSYAMSVLEKEEVEQAENGAVTWHVVDTTDDQVYLSGPVDAQAVTACEQTRGQILFQESTVMKPHYYSTSWGEKADGAVFSGEDTEYLKAAAVSVAESDIEEMNTDFINAYEAVSAGETGSVLSYDRESPWFRWTCRISLSQLSDKKVEDLVITKRGTGGYASCLAVFYEDGTAKQITGAKSIRRELGSPENVYFLQDGSTRSGLSILPSAFFYLDSVETSDGVQTVTMHGGGFGHGFGMSQYGAAEMAEEGYGYTEILAYYFDKADICEYY